MFHVKHKRGDKMGNKKKRKTFFDDSLMLNNYTYLQYVNRLTELSI